jgi:hypothetical protein
MAGGPLALPIVDLVQCHGRESRPYNGSRRYSPWGGFALVANLMSSKRAISCLLPRPSAAPRISASDSESGEWFSVRIPYA